ncbi:ExbD/TolR family protein [Methanobacterium oryzae]|uniref:ExbD/TolR family protein n=1 Tax=Methanobacterium oryzae TaxID=69540 RepID=UPI003D19B5DD
MALDVNKYRNKIRENNPRFNMVPFIDVVFTILIFLMVTSSFSAADQTQSDSGKPQMSESNGSSEYYLIPVAGLKKVTVNGQDMSSYIRNSAIAVHTNVIDYGEITIRPKNGEIIITTPPDFAIDKAVTIPSTG